jgi:Domain of unknown function (DUF927)/Domain of unknown function (DUF3854)
MAQPEGPPPASSGRSRPKVVPLPVQRELSAAHLEQLRASGLSDETIAAAELYTEPNPRALALILERAYPRGCGPALVIPFYLPGASEPHAYRIRPTTPRTEKRRGKPRPVKYDQAQRPGSLVYFTPRARTGSGYGEMGLPLYWTEGEKKALALEQLGLVCLGLTGVWNWSDAAERDASGGDRLHPAIRSHVVVAGREHVICFDADARENQQVMHAAARLGGVLLSCGATRVRFVCPPLVEGGPKGIDDYLAEHGPEATRTLLATAEQMEGVDPKRPRPRIRAIKAFADMPIHKEASLPDGFDLRDDGSLWRLSASERSPDVLVTPTPLFIASRYIDHDTQAGRVRLCWRDGDVWLHREVSQLAVGDAHTMVAELTPVCIPVVSTNAAKIVEWLFLYERLNADYIPKVVSFSRPGWHEHEGPVFVLDTPVLAEARTLEAVVDQSGQRGEIFAALKPRGDVETHLAALRRAWAASPVCAAMICGALVAPLLRMLGDPLNFGIHLIGESSRGKTTMLKIAASVYGDPANPLWVAAWNSTNVGAELRAAMLTDLPQCWDEVGGGDAVQLERLAYSIMNGTGRTRGQRDASSPRTTTRWRTIMLSTGEKSLVDETAATGAQIRVIELQVDGFGVLDAKAVDALKDACVANAGAFGRAWIETLLEVPDWPAWKAHLAARTETLRQLDPNPLQQRVAGYFALLSVAEEMAATFGLGEGGVTMERVFVTAESRTVVQGLAERSRELVENWVLSDPDAFPRLNLATSGNYELPLSNRPGLKVSGFRREEDVLFIPAMLRSMLRANRLTAAEVVRQWALRGWTRLDKGRTDTRVVVSGRQTRFTILLPNSSPEAE